MPGLAALLRLAEALGVPVERFAVGVEDPAGLEADPGPHLHEEGAGRQPAGGVGEAEGAEGTAAAGMRP
jgi:hypothetical protein